MVSIASPPNKETFSNFLKIVKFSMANTEGLLWALLYVFVSTFIVFPAITFDADLKMLSGLSNSAGWFVLLMNTVFSVFDTVGRKLGGVPAFDLSSGTVKVSAGLRTIFIATFYLVAF